MEKLRKCQGCFELKEADKMIKITKLKNGLLKLNPASNEVGRSVYVCKNPECIKNLIKKRRLNRGLKYSNSSEIQRIENILEGLI